MRERKRHTARRVASPWRGGGGGDILAGGGDYLGWRGTYLGPGGGGGVPILAMGGNYVGRVTDRHL